MNAILLGSWGAGWSEKHTMAFWALGRANGPEAPAFDQSWKPGDFEESGVSRSPRSTINGSTWGHAGPADQVSLAAIAPITLASIAWRVPAAAPARWPAWVRNSAARPASFFPASSLA